MHAQTTTQSLNEGRDLSKHSQTGAQVPPLTFDVTITPAARCEAFVTLRGVYTRARSCTLVMLSLSRPLVWALCLAQPQDLLHRLQQY